ncbi:FtsX-like permease family protein [Streptomyces sp. NPDC088925]|uniref:FtsX-like permease family protein n=1 Tax=Streptomyces sp. NPDC088925 TaxID=3365914 RepID=UPI00380C6E09
MSAVWRAARGAVRRRRLQSFVIGFVVLCSTTTLLLGLSVLSAAHAPFDRAFAGQRGPHTVATFALARTDEAALADTARAPGVEAAAGPYPQAVLDMPEDWLWMPPGSVTVVGRARPDAAVDRVRLLAGRWVTGPGEIVVNAPDHGTPNPGLLGTTVRARGVPPLTVVGFATSLGRTAGGWVTPAQARALHPAEAQMLYRFASASTAAELTASLRMATGDVPAGALTGESTYLALRSAYSGQADAYLLLLTLFGVLGLLVSVLVVANVVSGAVVSGWRHIGVLKALGFTPRQVVAVYLVMVSVPALTGCVLGVLIGKSVSPVLLDLAFSGVRTGGAPPVTGWWPPVVALLGVPLLLLCATLAPLARAHRLPAVRALSAGSGRGRARARGLRVQRRLAGSRLPRAVSLGLGQPFTRPGRSLLIVAAVLLGVTSVTLTTGLSRSFVALVAEGQGDGLHVDVTREPEGAPSDGATVDRLRGLPGTAALISRGLTRANLAGSPETVFVDFYAGDTRELHGRLAQGRWPTSVDEGAASPAFLRTHGLARGDSVTILTHGHRSRVRLVGELTDGGPDALAVHPATARALDPRATPYEYTVRLEKGTAPVAYAKRARASGVSATPVAPNRTVVTAVVGFSSVFTALLSAIAALGVLHNVLLSTWERRRELGVLKSLGMTPRQVVVMTVTSVTLLGLVGGALGLVPGIVAHRVLVDHLGVISFPPRMKDVWAVAPLLLLVTAGAAIAAAGAVLPARRAARLRIAGVLRGE